MTGRVCIVTGASSGIGKETARGLLRLGATVVLACRNPSKAQAVSDELVTGIAGATTELIPIDLASLASIRAFVEEFKARHRRLDLLVNNAGTVAGTRIVTADGYEAQFQVNYLGPFLLTRLLLDVLRASAPSRVVNVGSEVHRRGQIAFEDLQGERRYGSFRAYGNSKLALLLFTYELARRLEGSGVTVNCVHPGFIRTNLGMDDAGLGFRFVRLFIPGPEKGAETPLYVATSPALDGVTGKYFVKEAEAKSSPESYDAATARRLWEVSERLANAPPLWV